MMHAVACWLRASSFCAVALAVGLALAQPPVNPWHEVSSPSDGAPSSIGDYSSGCVRGARALDLDGEGYQVVHTERRRYFGHPELVDFVRKLGQQAHAKGLSAILVGDLGQPRGGPAPSGHASHQTGLDVDIWFASPPKTTGPLSQEEREHMKAHSVLDPHTQSIAKSDLSRVTELLKLTVADARVERVFVNPIIKRTLCTKGPTDRAWLAKLRPWYGHDDHFHVRLACPADSHDCAAQAPAPAGDGCDQIDWWFSEEARADRDKGKKAYQSKVARKPQLPEQCAVVLKDAP
jgi:penicillin-insensitive murein endopeptidase